ncbi:hypothetical protein CHL78_017790 [Romboutsia weinsteinii]|uniref:Uncharacterized protein n=1 Tax=Romboutsia weinsteinii TaxID=2020949 RepID=A0A371IYG7_9FIRM|nr:hypothetical protein [Romboutsia weinsteinii]RDY25519.1 hypothetical protein CHL78_017790 [Romboutsia weinsteinii]
MKFKKKLNKRKYIAIIIAVVALGKIGYEAFDKTSLAIDLINLGLRKKALIEAKKEESHNQEDEYTYVDDSKRYALVGDGEIKLDEKYHQDYIVKENKLYITANKGETWIRIPDDVEPGTSCITDYFNEITNNNIVISNDEVSIVYGGRGSDNITVLSGDIQGNIWSVSTLGKTANMDNEVGYDNMYIDFVDNGKTGYILIKQGYGEIFYRSVNSGVTWDNVTTYNEYEETITLHFKNKQKIN